MDLKDKRKIVESFSSSLNRNISRYKIEKNRSSNKILPDFSLNWTNLEKRNLEKMTAISFRKFETFAAVFNERKNASRVSHTSAG